MPVGLAKERPPAGTEIAEDVTRLEDSAELAAEPLELEADTELAARPLDLEEDAKLAARPLELEADTELAGRAVLLCVGVVWLPYCACGCALALATASKVAVTASDRSILTNFRGNLMIEKNEREPYRNIKYLSCSSHGGAGGWTRGWTAQCAHVAGPNIGIFFEL